MDVFILDFIVLIECFIWVIDIYYEGWYFVEWVSVFRDDIIKDLVC